MNVCANCRHCETPTAERVDLSAFAVCVQAAHVSPVTGRRTVYTESFASWQRRDTWFFARLHGTCGIEGRFFEPKQAAIEPKVIVLEQTPRLISGGKS